MRTLTIDQARRLALGAQGFARPRPAGRVDVRHLRRTLDHNAIVQLDSVNVAARAHYMPFFSRLGAYDRDVLDDWLWRSGENFEYLGHVASVMPVSLHPLMRHRMAKAHPWKGIRRLAEEQPGYVESVLAEVAERGPLRASDLSDPGRGSGSWWGWKQGRMALDWLYSTGDLAIHHRDAQFVLYYDVPERVLPAEVLAAPTPSPDEARRELIALAARAHGVATLADLADHFRLRLGPARAAVETLVAAGRLEPVRVRGWDEPAYRDPSVPVPRRIGARALLSPFDPVVWFRQRAERLFDFEYRIEIYVPEAKRVHGYYVLPFLLDDRLVARVDLRADRSGRRLEVRSAFQEPGHDRGRVARELATELQTMAGWLGLDEVTVADRGDLARQLRRAVP